MVVVVVVGQSSHPGAPSSLGREFLWAGNPSLAGCYIAASAASRLTAQQGGVYGG